MNKGWAIFWGILLAVAIPGGIALGIGAHQLSQICYQMAGFKITAFDRRNLYMDIGIRIWNKSFLSVKIKEYNLNIYLNDVLCSNSKSETEKEVVANNSTSLTIPLSVDFIETFGAINSAKIISLFATKQYDKIQLSVDGYIKVKLGASFKYNLKKEDWTWTLSEILKIMSEPSTPC